MMLGTGCGICSNCKKEIEKMRNKLKEAELEEEEGLRESAGVVDQVEPLVPRGLGGWISIHDEKPSQKEPVVYARPDLKRGNGNWNVGIAYWTVSEKWNPEAQSERCPRGFTHWMPLPSPPIL